MQQTFIWIWILSECRLLMFSKFKIDFIEKEPIRVFCSG